MTDTEEKIEASEKSLAEREDAGRESTDDAGKAKNGNRPLIAHLSLFTACAIWGLMAPVGKDAMMHGIDGISMVSFRVAGGCLLFWLASLFVKRERVPWRDRLLFIGAALFGLVFNQCCYTIGLSITSPINSSIVTTSMPIFSMILAALILKEPITSKKVLGVMMGCSGAVILILTSAHHGDGRVGDIRGDLLCVGAHGVGHRQRAHRHRHFQVEPGSRRHPRLHRRVVRNQIPLPSRYGETGQREYR